MKNNNQHEQAQFESTPEMMEQILKRNDKFETVKVLMEILCKELEITTTATAAEIMEKLHQISIDYYQAMDDWKNMRKAMQPKGEKIKG